MEKNMVVVDRQCAIEDDLAKGIAAHLLNPSIKTPITVGIAGDCGSGEIVTSLMKKIECHLLLTAAQGAFPTEFNGKANTDLTEKGRRIKQGVDNLLAKKDKEKQVRPSKDFNGNEEGVASLLPKQNPEQEHTLLRFLEEYQPEHKAVYKYLACLELNQLVKDQENQRKEKFSGKDQRHESSEKSSMKDSGNEKLVEIPRVLTLKFSAEDYTGTHEACDGLVVEITKVVENSLTRAQRWSTFWSHNKQSYLKLVDLLIAAGIFAVVFVAWSVIDHFNVSNFKYGTILAFIFAVAAPALRQLVSTYNWKEVSKYVGDHLRSSKSDEYARQQTVISKIKLLKKECGGKPSPFFSFIAGEKWNYWWGFKEEKIEKTPVPKYGSAPQEKLRIIAFMDGLDRYEDSVIVRVLQSLNTVLKTCEINFVLALDKDIMRKAFKSSSKEECDPDHLISQIIQLPVTLYPVFRANSTAQDNTTNDIEKQHRHRSKNECKELLLSRVTQIRDMSMMKNNDDEDATFNRFSRFSREIVGLHQNYIKYHTFARNVISQMDSIKESSGWRKELVAWIFICSQWKQEMDILIQDWHMHVDVKEDGTKQEPSLKRIVANYIKQKEGYREKEKNAADSEGEGKKEVGSKEEEKENRNTQNGDLSGWNNLNKALDQVQDVSMEHIQRFQHFRFHCVAGYLNLRQEL